MGISYDPLLECFGDYTMSYLPIKDHTIFNARDTSNILEVL